MAMTDVIPLAIVTVLITMRQGMEEADLPGGSVEDRALLFRHEENAYPSMTIDSKMSSAQVRKLS